MRDHPCQGRLAPDRIPLDGAVIFSRRASVRVPVRGRRYSLRRGLSVALFDFNFRKDLLRLDPRMTDNAKNAQAFRLRIFLPADTMNLTRDDARKAAEQLDPAEPTACEAASGGI